MSRVRVCAKGELPDDGAARVMLDGIPVAVFFHGGEYYALADTCSHEESSLSEGLIEDGEVECPKHGSLFDLKTGRALTLPATRPVATYAVRVEGDEIYVESTS
ncbi:MAG TPA: bifunctional 3-phenylpropionate/cinnamic acid dioxygenase ferredoxin subunit [Actinomycetota bacterium]